MSHRSRHLPYLLSALQLVSSAAVAGALTISPIRLELSPDHPIETVEVRNEGAETVTVQLERMAWSQSQGDDVYVPSSALIATPTVFEVAPHAAQTLRVALRTGAPRSVEQAFRLYVREVPAERDDDGTGLKMALRIGIPVFATKQIGRPHLVSAWVTQSDGTMALKLRNDGDRFARTGTLEVIDTAGAVLWETHDPAYLLAAGEHVWPTKLALPDIAARRDLVIAVSTENGIERIDAPPGF